MQLLAGHSSAANLGDTSMVEDVVLQTFCTQRNRTFLEAVWDCGAARSLEAAPTRTGGGACATSGWETFDNAA